METPKLMKIVFKSGRSMTVPYPMAEDVIASLLKGSGQFHTFKINEDGKICLMLNLAEIESIIEEDIIKSATYDPNH